MEKRNDKKISQQQSGKKPEVGSKTSTTTRPEIDLPLKGGRSEADLANKNQPRRDERSDSDKRSVR